MSSSHYQKYKHHKIEWRKRKNAEGLCIACGKNPQRDTSKLCRACTERSIENRRKLQAKRTSEGFCSACLTKPAAPNRKLCQTCSNYKKTWGGGNLRKRCLQFGIDETTYKALVEKQNGLCASCHGLPGGRSGVLHIDHCHKTGKVRGLLCHKCNRGLGLFNDDIAKLRMAISYLETNQPLRDSNYRHTVRRSQHRQKY